MFRSHCVEAHLSLPYYRLVVEYYHELLRSQKKSNDKFIQVNLLYTYRDCIWNNVRNTTGKRQPWDLIFQYGVTINYEFLWMLTNQPHKSFKMAAAIQPSLKIQEMRSLLYMFDCQYMSEHQSVFLTNSKESTQGHFS